MIVCYGGFFFIPTIPARNIPDQSSYNFNKSDGICSDTLLTVNENEDSDSFFQNSLNSLL